MTMPVPKLHAAPPAQTIELPPPGYPLLTRMISDPLFPPEQPGAKDEPVTWGVSKPHPLVPEMKVVRMFVEEGGGAVAVYSVAGDGATGMRNLIPMARTRLVEEAMPLEIFIDELAIAERGEDPDEPDNGDEAPPQDDPPQESQATPTPDDTPPPPAAAESSSDGQPESS